MLLIVLEVYFSLLFSNKADFRVCFVARKIRSPLFFMSIPISWKSPIIYYDDNNHHCA